MYRGTPSCDRYRAQNPAHRLSPYKAQSRPPGSTTKWPNSILGRYMAQLYTKSLNGPTPYSVVTWPNSILSLYMVQLILSCYVAQLHT